MVRQRIVAWNTKARANSAVGRTILAQARLDGVVGIALLETVGGRKNIGGRRVASVTKSMGWRVITGKGSVGSSSQLVLNPGLRLLSSGVRTVSTRWRGPKSAWRNIKGRAFPWAVVTLNGRTTLIVAVHMPWKFGVKSNRDAWKHCILMLRSLADAYSTADMLFTGDWNVSPSDNRQYSAQWLAREIGGQVVPGAGIDFSVVRRSTAGPNAAKPVTPTAKSIGKGGSDHHAIINTL